VELTVLGSSGSFNAPLGGPCSGYLVRSGDTSIWLDCGNGTFGNLQQHVDAENLTAVVITHEHPDHCVDIYGLHVLMRYGLEREGLPVVAPEGLAEHLGRLTSDTGPGWSPDAFAPDADLVLSEATYLHGEKPVEIHLSAREAGLGARGAGARRLMLTHLWPRIDHHRAVDEGSDAYGEPVVLAAPHLVTRI
jgi:ribonuclease BN (tRNA processing enzyme)